MTEMKQKLARNRKLLSILGFLPLFLAMAILREFARNWLARSFLVEWYLPVLLIFCFFAGYVLPRVIVSARKWWWVVLLGVGVLASFPCDLLPGLLFCIAFLLSSLLGTWIENRFGSETSRRSRLSRLADGTRIVDTFRRFCRKLLVVLGPLGLFILVAPLLMVLAINVAHVLFGGSVAGSPGAAVAGVMLQSPYWIFSLCAGYALPTMWPSTCRWGGTLLLAAGLSACPFLCPGLFLPFAWAWVGGVKNGLMVLLPLTVSCLIGRWIRDMVDTREVRASQSS